MTFPEAALDLHQKMLEDKKDEEAKSYDVWAALAIRYGFCVVGVRSEFYKMAARDPTYAKAILPKLQQRSEFAAADDLTAAMDNLDTHMTTALMKVVANLSGSDAMKRTGKGASAAYN